MSWYYEYHIHDYFECSLVYGKSLLNDFLNWDSEYGNHEFLVYLIVNDEYSLNFTLYFDVDENSNYGFHSVYPMVSDKNF